jgi:uncharacterized Fe-S cluster protein YjdI
VSDKRGPAREYANGEVVVEWWPSLCFHSHNCVRALPQVFDPERRPWVQIDAAGPAEVEAAVARCPSGALRTRRPGQEAVAPADGAELRVSKNGPLLLRGGVRVFDVDGNLVFEGDAAAFCRCGGSANKPFCDGTHARNGFSG